jgi:2-polyprenyl-6-methoxyphenol hydroxylase-like FAD-dependent oxidoreductase
MVAVQTVAIAGSGAAGLALAVRLARAGVDTTVFESTSEFTALGSGISLQGNALRVFMALGLEAEVMSVGFAFDGVALRAPGPDATVIARMTDGPQGGGAPASLGMYRPDMARVLLEAAQAAGAAVRYGSPVTGLRQEGDAVHVEVDGEDAGVFDLVVGADGLHSAVRRLIGIEVKPEPLGMGIWRATVSRPPEVGTTELYYGGPMYIAGYTPTGEETMYAFLVEAAQDRSQVPPDEGRRIMIGQSRAYGGPWEQIRADLERYGSDDGAHVNGAHINYTWFTHHLVPEPWNRGRAVVIGDAAHSCPPTVAQGAAMALEDALVLGDLLVERDAVDDALWAAFHSRRLPRATAVVDASVQLAVWQRDGVRGDVGALMGGLNAVVGAPA